MRKKLLNVKLVLFIILIIVFLTSGCNSNVIRQKEEEDSIVGSGKVIREKIDVGSFQGVKPMLQANLYVTQDGTNTLEIEAYENLFDIIETSITNGILNIKTTRHIDTSFPKGFLKKPVNIYVSMDKITDLTMAGSGKLLGQTEISSDALNIVCSGSGKVDLNLKAIRLSTKLSGSGTINLKGTATEHDLILSGSGRLKAYDLITEKTKAIISGSGSANVNASKELSSRVSGSGKIRYKGDPKIISQ
jgi:hypothetical protein